MTNGGIHRILEQRRTMSCKYLRAISDGAAAVLIVAMVGVWLAAFVAAVALFIR